MKSILAASAVLALAGSSYGFVIEFVSVQAGESITPSTGGFQYYAGGFDPNAWLGAGSIVTGNRATWRNYSSYINSDTWLALDPLGGAAGYSTVLEGPGEPDPIIPFAPGSSAQWLGDANSGLQVDGSAILGGAAGARWSTGAADNFQMSSAVSPVNGTSVDSVFIGHFVFIDPGAVLTGADLLARIDGQDVFVPLDGSPGTGGYRMEYESGLTPLLGEDFVDAFIVVPAPGGVGLLAIAGVAASRRRR